MIIYANYIPITVEEEYTSSHQLYCYKEQIRTFKDYEDLTYAAFVYTELDVTKDTAKIIKNRYGTISGVVSTKVIREQIQNTIDHHYNSIKL